MRTGLQAHGITNLPVAHSGIRVSRRKQMWHNNDMHNKIYTATRRATPNLGLSASRNT